MSQKERRYMDGDKSSWKEQILRETITVRKLRRGEKAMNEYEVFIEDINPCGGSQHAKKELIEVEAESPEAYVKENGRFPITEITKNAEGDTVITTGDGKGYIVRYTFSE